MAKSVVVRVTCDRCGAEVAEGSEIQFSLGGSSYGIDLCESDKGALEAAMAPFIASGHRVTPTRPGLVTATAEVRRPRPARRDPEQVAAIREWARSHGFQVSDRGRIPAEAERAYNARKSR